MTKEKLINEILADNDIKALNTEDKRDFENEKLKYFIYIYFIFNLHYELAFFEWMHKPTIEKLQYIFNNEDLNLWNPEMEKGQELMLGIVEALITSTFEKFNYHRDQIREDFSSFCQSWDIDNMDYLNQIIKNINIFKNELKKYPYYKETMQELHSMAQELTEWKEQLEEEASND